eukprot:c25665_g1_i2 orf=181-1149(+)
MASYNVRLAALQRHLVPYSCSAHLPLENLERLENLGFRIEPRVREALLGGFPVVALESTIISHGMPYPQNLVTANEVERIVKENGAIPATIAILCGVPCIGLTAGELQAIAQLGTNVVKTARRDIAYVISQRMNGATTVSATMFFAAKAGIRVFATGGIGGVHRYGESTMDISSDLTELGRTPVAVICAGTKSILDIPRTLEYLETQGVTVVGYGTGEFPAFFTRKSGCKVPCRADTPIGCAEIINTSFKLNLQSGVLIGVPIPEHHAAAAEPINLAIQRALKESMDQDISGSAVTPFLLNRVNDLTGGASLAASILLPGIS